jgi:hypothetical protein
MRSPSVIFTEQQREEIKQRAAAGEKLCHLCKEYKVARYRITEVITGITYRQKMMDLPSAEEQKESDVRTLLVRAKRYWTVFKVGDSVSVKYKLGKSTTTVYGVISYKNRYYLNVKSGIGIFEVKMSDLILGADRTILTKFERMG